METLLEILNRKRPHGGVGETYVAEQILTRLPRTLSVYKDKDRKPMAYVYCTDEESTTLFTAHLDTVHRKEGMNPVVYDKEMQWMSKEDGECLGADDGAGVWLLYKMAMSDVPGTYLFTVGEECGGIGAKWLAANATKFLSKFNRAIAFDRRGTGSVITDQAYGVCCSDEFATALSNMFNCQEVGDTYVFAPDSGGVYTDTAEFTEIIPECTNISTGYYNEHTGKETLDVGYLELLLKACLEISWDKLPEVRDPKAPVKYYNMDKYRVGGRTVSSSISLDMSDLVGMSLSDIDTLISNDPSAVADMLYELINDFEWEEGRG